MGWGRQIGHRPSASRARRSDAPAKEAGTAASMAWIAAKYPCDLDLLDPLHAPNRSRIPLQPGDDMATASARAVSSPSLAALRPMAPLCLRLSQLHRQRQRPDQQVSTAATAVASTGRGHCKPRIGETSPKPGAIRAMSLGLEDRTERKYARTAWSAVASFLRCFVDAR